MNQQLTTSSPSQLNLDEAVGRLQSREDFVVFLRGLSADLQRNPEQWANRDLPAFLEAMSAWVEDMEGYYRGRGEPMPEQPRWQTLGQILLAARVYE
jgi:hypothetical protein